jgi:peptidoglycan hydrolase-like protein with peptidoglycan-binding domain
VAGPGPAAAPSSVAGPGPAAAPSSVAGQGPAAAPSSVAGQGLRLRLWLGYKTLIICKIIILVIAGLLINSLVTKKFSVNTDINSIDITKDSVLINKDATNTVLNKQDSSERILTLRESFLNLPSISLDNNSDSASNVSSNVVESVDESIELNDKNKEKNLTSNEEEKITNYALYLTNGEASIDIITEKDSNVIQFYNNLIKHSPDGKSLRSYLGNKKYSEKNIITLMQVILQYLNFYNGQIDGIAGKKFNKAINDYMKYYNIPIEDNFKKEFTKHIFIQIEYIFRIITFIKPISIDKAYIDDDKYIQVSQLFLGLLDIYKGNYNEQYNVETLSAVIKFQKDIGMEPDGIVSNELFYNLMAIYCLSYSKYYSVETLGDNCPFLSD